ncbi:MAG: hypothetical protein HRS50_02280, partial [Mycoplasmataceae bacterium]|nr:hypothetical protein [Mycoplasmataceae bacterium]
MNERHLNNIETYESIINTNKNLRGYQIKPFNVFVYIFRKEEISNMDENDWQSNSGI